MATTPSHRLENLFMDRENAAPNRNGSSVRKRRLKVSWFGAPFSGWARGDERAFR
jgi:hypothetical protein